MEFLTEHIGLDWTVHKTVCEDVNECILIDRVFRDTARKVAKVLCKSMHITLTLLDPEERRALSRLSSWSLNGFFESRLQFIQRPKHVWIVKFEP